MDNSATNPIDDGCGFYDLDPSTGRIRFRTDDVAYKTLRSAMQSHGIDIDRIETEDELFRLWDQVDGLVTDIVVARSLARHRKSVDSDWLKAVLSGNQAEANRLSQLMAKRQSLGLRSVK